MITLNNRTIYGKVTGAYNSYFKMKKGTELCTFISIDGNQLSINYDVPLNTYKHTNAILITKKEWDEALRMFKTKMKTI